MNGYPFLNEYDATNGKLRFSIRTAADSDGYYAVSPNSDFVLGSIMLRKHKRHQLKVWSLADGKEVASIDVDDFHLFAVTLSPDGRTIAAQGYDDVFKKNPMNFLLLFSLENGKLAKQVAIPFEDRGISTVVFNPSGTHLAATTYKHKRRANGELENDPEKCYRYVLQSIDLQSKLIQTSAELPIGFSSSLCFSPEGQQIAVGSLGRVLLFDLTLGISKRPLE